MNTRRPLTVIIAIVLLTLVSLLDLIELVIPARVPPLFVYTIPVLGVGGLMAVFGLWKMKRWGLLLTSILSALSILWNIPGLFIPRTLGGKAITMGYIAFYILVLALVALPATRKAFAAARASAEQQEAQP